MITKEELSEMALLAKIELSEEESESCIKDMKGLFDICAGVKSFEGAVVGESYGLSSLRPDTVSQSLKREELLKSSPASEAGCVLVPRMKEES